MFLSTLNPLSFRNVNDQVSHPYKTTGKIIILYNLGVRPFLTLRDIA